MLSMLVISATHCLIFCASDFCSFQKAPTRGSSFQQARTFFETGPDDVQRRSSQRSENDYQTAEVCLAIPV